MQYLEVVHRENWKPIMLAANHNREAITVFVAILLQHWWNKYSSDCFVVIFFFFSFYFLNAIQSGNNSNTILILMIFTVLLCYLSSSERKTWRILLWMGLEPCEPLWCQWSALPVELSGQLGACRYVGQWQMRRYWIHTITFVIKFHLNCGWN